MSYRITIQPTGHQFDVEKGETLLDGALRNGVHLKYQCATGTCGSCKIKVLEGQAGDVEFHDYPITEAEKLQNIYLVCRTHAASDMTIQATEIDDPNDIPHQKLSARISRLERREGTLLLSLRTPRTQTLQFLAGQAVTLRVDGVGKQRFAVASCPCNGMIVQFHIDEEDTHPLAQHFIHHARVADVATIAGPFGRFLFDEEKRYPVVLVAEREGFAPIKSLIEHLIAIEWPYGIRLFWIAEPGGHYMENQCRAWADALDNFRYQLIPLNDQNYYLKTAADIVAVGELDQSSIYISTYPAMVSALKASLEVAGISPVQILVYA